MLCRESFDNLRRKDVLATVEYLKTLNIEEKETLLGAYIDYVRENVMMCLAHAGYYNRLQFNVDYDTKDVKYDRFTEQFSLTCNYTPDDGKSGTIYFKQSQEETLRRISISDYSLRQCDFPIMAKLEQRGVMLSPIGYFSLVKTHNIKQIVYTEFTSQKDKLMFIKKYYDFENAAIRQVMKTYYPDEVAIFLAADGIDVLLSGEARMKAAMKFDVESFEYLFDDRKFVETAIKFKKAVRDLGENLQEFITL